MKPERIVPLPPSARSLGLEAGGKLQPEARAFYRRWLGWTVAGEAAGFTAAAITGALAATHDLPTVPEFALLVGAGSIEGALLGAGQAIAMMRLQLPPRMLLRWPVVTSVAAALAWLIGLLPSSIPHIPWSSPVTWLLGSALLLSIPTAQYLLLRSVIHTAGRWIWVNRPRLVARHLLDLRALAAGQCEYTDPFADRHLRHGRVADGNHGRGDHWPVLAQLVEERNHPDSERGRLVAERSASGVSRRLTRERSWGFSADRALPGGRLLAGWVGHRGVVGYKRQDQGCLRIAEREIRLSGWAAGASRAEPEVLRETDGAPIVDAHPVIQLPMALAARQGRGGCDESPGHARIACLRDYIQPEDLTGRGFGGVWSQTCDPLRAPVAFGEELVVPVHPTTPELLVMVDLIGQLRGERFGRLLQGA